MSSGYATSLINLFPTTSEVALRAGAADHSTGYAGLIKDLLSYNPATGAPKLFASNDSGIYDATAAGVHGAVQSIGSSGYVRSLNYRTVGSSWLLVVNGVDDLRRFNGTVWDSIASFPVVGGGTLLTNRISNLAAFKRRIFFTESGTTDVYSLPLDSVAGSVNPFPLGAQFDKGGSVVAIGTWTIDGGAGPDDRIVFLSSKGQAAVYSGVDPTDPNNWSLVGRYDLAEPLGRDPFIKYGGDLLYLSRTGLYPFSQSLQSTTIASAISDNIRDAFIKAGANYATNQGWCVAIDQPNSLLIVNVPVTTLGFSIHFVMNLVTKAWTQFQDWNAFCFRYHNGQLYMGSARGVGKAFVGLSDFGASITGTGKVAPDYLGRRGTNKKISLIRPVIKISGVASVEMAVDTDFRNDAQFGPTSFTSGGGATWDTSVWAVAGDPAPAVWADDAGIRLDYHTVAANPAYAFAVRLRFVSKAAKVSWTATDILFEVASLT